MEIQSKYLSHEWLYGNASDDLCHADCKIFVDEQPFNRFDVNMTDLLRVTVRRVLLFHEIIISRVVEFKEITE